MSRWLAIGLGIKLTVNFIAVVIVIRLAHRILAAHRRA